MLPPGSSGRLEKVEGGWERGFGCCREHSSGAWVSVSEFGSYPHEPAPSDPPIRCSTGVRRTLPPGGAIKPPAGSRGRPEGSGGSCGCGRGVPVMPHHPLGDALSPW